MEVFDNPYATDSDDDKIMFKPKSKPKLYKPTPRSIQERAETSDRCAPLSRNWIGSTTRNVHNSIDNICKSSQEKSRVDATMKAKKVTASKGSLVMGTKLSGDRQGTPKPKFIAKGTEWRLNCELHERIGKRDRATWDGGFDATGQVSGNGTYSSYAGMGKNRLEYRYTGSCLDGRFTGKGFLQKFSTKGFLQYDYDGDFLKDKFDGLGTMTIYSPDGKVLETYAGPWKEGKRHGNGKCIFEDGSTHQGIWENHRICGQGEWTYPADSPSGFKMR